MPMILGYENMSKELANDGELVNLIELTNANGMSAVFMDIGATWLSCRLPMPTGENREVLLGVNTLSAFYQHTSYMGVTVGRVANRIKNGQFVVDDKQYQVFVNQNGHCLHGGKEGFDKRRWQITDQSTNSVTFFLVSVDGDQGFPGTLSVSVTYSLADDNALLIEYQAETDKNTPINLTNHAYFNLDGAEKGADCLSHRLTIHADHYLPTDHEGIPLGELDAVKNTGFDFTQQKKIGTDLLCDSAQKQAKGYDHSYFFPLERDKKQAVAELTSSQGDIRLDVFTTKPAMQLYTGNWLRGTPSRSGEYRDYSGVALETQFLPDAINHPDWLHPLPILTPSETYHFATTYRFSMN